MKDRRFHSLQSASKALGVHPKLLGKRLEAEGHLDLSKSGPDRLIPAWVISSIYDPDFADLGFAEATGFLGVSKYTIETLVTAGILKKLDLGDSMRARLDGQSVNKFASWLKALPEGSDENGRDVRAICRLFLMRAPDVLKLMWEGNLPNTSRLTGRVDYHSIRILPQDIEACTNADCRPALSFFDVARRLRIEPKLLNEILASGLMRSRCDDQCTAVTTSILILEEDLQSFEAKYSILISGSDVATMKRLRRANALEIKPLLTDGVAFIYLKSQIVPSK